MKERGNKKDKTVLENLLISAESRSVITGKEGEEGTVPACLHACMLTCLPCVCEISKTNLLPVAVKADAR